MMMTIIGLKTASAHTAYVSPFVLEVVNNINTGIQKADQTSCHEFIEIDKLPLVVDQIDVNTDFSPIDFVEEEEDEEEESDDHFTKKILGTTAIAVSDLLMCHGNLDQEIEVRSFYKYFSYRSSQTWYLMFEVFRI